MSNNNNLVVVHGFLSGSDYWHKQDPLAEYTNIIKIQLPGYGNRVNEKVCASIEDFAQSVIAQVNEKTNESFDLIGHSMGGMIAQEVTKQNPDRVNKLILYGTGPIGDVPSRFERMSISLEKANPSSYLKDISTAVASWFMDYDKNPDYSEAEALAHRANFDAYLGGLHAMQKWNGIDSLKNIKQETLIVYGEEDRTYDISQQTLLNENITHSKIVGIPNSAHNTHLEKPNEFNAIVRAFLYAND